MSASALIIARKGLRERRRGLVLWSAALAAVTAIYMAFYPSMGANPALAESLEQLPEGLASAMGWNAITGGAGYLAATVYGLLLPLLLIVFAIGLGARFVAGEEEAGVLDLYLAHPVSRRRLIVERFAAMCAVLGAFGLVLWPEVAALSAAYDMGVGLAEAGAATLGLVLLALCFGSVALAAGAVTGRQGFALGISAAAAVTSYLLDKVAPQVAALGGFEKLSPFYYYLSSDPLRTGFDWVHVSVLVAIPVVLLGVAVVTFDRRDVNV